MFGYIKSYQIEQSNEINIRKVKLLELSDVINILRSGNDIKEKATTTARDIN